MRAMRVPGCFRVLLLLILCAALSSCSAARRNGGGSATPEDLGPEAAVIEAHRALITAYESRDAKAFVELLDPSPELLIFHPLQENRFDGIEEAKAGLERMFQKIGTVQWTEAHTHLTLRGDVAWVTAHVVVDSAMLALPFVGRSTEIWVRTSGSWRLIHAHWSTVPGV